MSSICLIITPTGDRAYILTDTAFISPQDGSIHHFGDKVRQITHARIAFATRGLSNTLDRTERILQRFSSYDEAIASIQPALVEEFRRELGHLRRRRLLNHRPWVRGLLRLAEKKSPVYDVDCVIVGWSEKARRFRAALLTSQAVGPQASRPFALSKIERDILLPYLDDDARKGAGYIANNPGSIYKFDWTSTPAALVRMMDAQRSLCLERRRSAVTETEWRAPEIIGGHAVLTTLYADGRIERKAVHSWDDKIGIPLVENPYK